MRRIAPGSHAVVHINIITSHGHLECLHYLHSQGYVWDKMSTYKAAEGGHLACLQYMHQHDCPWDATVTRAAAYLIEQVRPPISTTRDCVVYTLVTLRCRIVV